MLWSSEIWKGYSLQVTTLENLEIYAWERKKQEKQKNAWCTPVFSFLELDLEYMTETMSPFDSIYATVTISLTKPDANTELATPDDETALALCNVRVWHGRLLSVVVV